MYITLYKVHYWIFHIIYTQVQTLGLFTSGNIIINPKFVEKEVSDLWTFWMILRIEQRISRTPEAYNRSNFLKRP